MITEYGIGDAGRWNAVVRSFSDYEVFYLAEYVTAFMNEDPRNGIPILLLFMLLLFFRYRRNKRAAQKEKDAQNDTKS